MSLALLALAVLGFAVVIGAIWTTLGLISLALHLAVAGLVGALADWIVPGKLPWGWVGAILAGLVGGWIGTLILGHVGPRLMGVPIVPAFVGATVIAVVASLLSHRSSARG